MASPLQRLHRSRGLPLSREALLGFSSGQIRLDDLAPHRFGASEGSAIGRVSAGQALSFAVSVAALLVSISRSRPLQHITRGQPVLIQLRASRPAEAQCVLPPLMGFCGRSRGASHDAPPPLFAIAAASSMSGARPPLLPPRFRALATNAVPSVRPSSIESRARVAPTPLQGLSSTGATDTLPSPPSCLALPPHRRHRCTSECSRSYE